MRIIRTSLMLCCLSLVLVLTACNTAPQDQEAPRVEPRETGDLIPGVEHPALRQLNFHPVINGGTLPPTGADMAGVLAISGMMSMLATRGARKKKQA